MKSVGRRSLALILSVLMTLSLISTVSFAEGNVAADAQNQEADKQVVQEVQPDAAEAPAAVAEDKTEAEAKQPAAPVEKAFSQSKIVDGVKVAVTADKGVFPADAQLSVTKVAVPAAVDTKDAAKAYAFDITILAGGKKIQPDGRANVSFTTAEVAQYDTDVYHMVGATAQKMGDSESGNTASVTTKSFSVYVLSLKTTKSGSEAQTAIVEINHEYSFTEILSMAGETKPEGSVYESNFAGFPITSRSDLTGEGYLTVTEAFSSEEGKRPYVGVDDGDTLAPIFKVELFAVGERRTATFMNGDTQVGDKVVADADGKVTPPAAPTMDPTGATDTEFKYWYTTDGATEYNFDTPISQDTTFNAKWGPKSTAHTHAWKVVESTIENGKQATITCEGEGDCEYKNPGFTVSLTAEDSQVDDPKAAEYESNISEDAKDLVKLSGIVYYDMADPAKPVKLSAPPTTAGTYEARMTIYGKANESSDRKSLKTLKAAFTITAPEYQVTFNTDGGEPTPEAQTVPAGGKAPAPTEEVKKDGFTFDGWFLGEATTPFDFANTEINESIELKARWTETPAPAHTHVWALNRAEDGTQSELYCSNNCEEFPLGKGFNFKIDVADFYEADTDITATSSYDSDKEGFPSDIYSMDDLKFYAGEIKKSSDFAGKTPMTAAEVKAAGEGVYTARAAIRKNGSITSNLFKSFEVTAPHEHDWKMEVVESTNIKSLTCKNTDGHCEFAGQSVEIEIAADDDYAAGDSYEYPGAEPTVTPANNSSGLAELIESKLGDIEYRTVGTPKEQGTTDLPTEPGDYWARATIPNKKTDDGSAVAIQFRIVKATVEQTETTFNYGETEPLLTTQWSHADPSPYVIQYMVDGQNPSTTIPTTEGLGTGQHTVSYQVLNGTTVVDSGEFDFTINAISVTVTPPTAISDLTYTGSAQQLATAAEAPLDPATLPDELSLKYAVTDASATEAPAASEFNADITQVTGTDTGAYKVWYQVFNGDDKYEGTDYEFTPSASGSIDVSIGRKEIVVVLPTEKGGLIYNGNDQGLIDNAGSVTDPASGYVFKYAVGAVDIYDEDVAKVTGKNADTYTISYKVFKKGEGEGAEDEECTTEDYKFVTKAGGTEIAFEDLSVVIAPANPVKTEPQGVEEEATGSDQNLIKEGELEDFAVADGLVFWYSLSPQPTSFGPNTPKESAPDNYEVFWTVNPDNNTNYVPVGIKSVDSKIYDHNVVPPTPYDDLVYDGSDQALIEEPAEISAELEQEGGIVLYAVSDSKETAPTKGYTRIYDNVKGKDAGDYYIWYKVVKIEDGNQTILVEPDYITATIDKAQAEFTTEPEPLFPMYAGVGRWVNTKGATSDGTILFSYDGGEEYGNRAKQIDAGEYEVWYYIKGDENHYDSEPATLDAEITPRVVVLAWDGDEYTYDGTEKQPTATVTNLVTREDTGEQDEVTVTVGGGQTDAGEYTGENGAVATELGGADAKNYTLPEEPYHDFSIIRQQVIIRWFEKEGDSDPLDEDPAYTYNGQIQGPVAVVYNLDGTAPIEGLGVTVTGLEKDATPDGEKYTATVTGLTGEKKDNYEIATTDPDTTTQDYTITPKTITIASGIKVKDKIYDKTTDAELSNDYSSIKFDGLVEGDKVTVSALEGTAKYKDFNAGSNKDADVNITSVTLGGESADNYTVETPFDAVAKGTINRKPVTIASGIKANDKVYDGNPKATLDLSEAVLDGVIDDDEVTVVLYDEEDLEAQFADKNVGEWDVTFDAYWGLDIDGANADNYYLAREGNQEKARAKITPKPVGIEGIKAKNKVYDGNTDAELDGSTAKVLDVILGDTVYVKTDLGTGTFSDENVGDGKTVTIDLSDKEPADIFVGVAAGNYTLDDAYKTMTTTANITPRIVELEWYKDAETKAVDPIEYTYDGTTNQKPIAKITNKARKTDDVGVKVSVPNHKKDVGEYTAKATELTGNSKGNYRLATTTETQFFYVPLTVTVNGITAKDKVYDGNTEAELDATGAQIVTKVDGDDVSVVVDGKGTFEDKNAGDDKNVTIAPATISLSGEDAKNYNLDKENSQKTTTADIDKRVANITWDPAADPAEFTYNGKEQAPKATVSNKVPGDDLKADVGGAEKDAGGPYTATVTLSGDDAQNYELPNPAPTKQFVINKAELTVTASDQSIYYGEDFDKTKVTYKGWAEGDDESKLETPATVTSNYFVNAKAGTYKLTPSGAAAKNYTFKYVDGKLTVKNKVTWLVAKAASQGSKRGRLSWNKVTGAKTYEVWFARCNSKTKKYRMKKVATVKRNSYTKGGLKKGVCYKYYVIAKDAKGKRIAKSLDAHFAVGNNNRAGTNCKTLTVNKTSVSLAAGKTFTIKAKQKGYIAKKRLLDGTHTKLFRYTSTNKAVATVNAKGKITAVGKGYCQVYVQACNGLWKAINVTVK